MSKPFNELLMTQDGTLTLRHPGYDEAFHSSHGARLEADSLYMEASGFRDCMKLDAGPEAMDVLDVGLGLGYNALATIECWMNGIGAGDLNLVSLEEAAELVMGLADPGCAWKSGWSETWQIWSRALSMDAEGVWRAQWTHPKSGRILRWQVLVGDARTADLSAFRFQYIWQDAFSHKKNPELWSIAWFEKLHAASHPAVQLVTYSVARLVRDHLEAAAWSPERVKTPQASAGGKKQWLLARLKTT